MLSRGHRTLDKYLILIEFTHLVGFSERGRCRNDILKKDVCNHKRHSRPWLLEVQLLCNFCCAFLFQCSDNSLILIYCPLNVPSLFIWKSTDSGMFRQQQCLLGDWVLTFDFISLKKKKIQVDECEVISAEIILVSMLGKEDEGGLTLHRTCT